MNKNMLLINILHKLINGGVGGRMLEFLHIAERWWS